MTQAIAAADPVARHARERAAIHRWMKQLRTYAREDRWLMNNSGSPFQRDRSRVNRQQRLKTALSWRRWLRRCEPNEDVWI